MSFDLSSVGVHELAEFGSSTLDGLLVKLFKDGNNARAVNIFVLQLLGCLAEKRNMAATEVPRTGIWPRISPSERGKVGESDSGHPRAQVGL